MRQTRVAIATLGLLAWPGIAGAQYQGGRATTEATGEVPPWWEEEKPRDTRGYVGGLLAAGIGVNGQLDTNAKAYVDTSVLFALRGGLTLGKGNRWLLGFEVAPATNRLDWRLRATATGFVSFGELVPLKRRKGWAWLWKIGLGVGGGRDYRFLVGVQVDVLTFNYKMNDRLWVDLGVPTIRFHIETSNQGRYNTQFVFPLGITFAI